MGFCATESAIFLRLGTFHGLQRLSVSFVHAGLQLRKRDKENISISDARTGRVNRYQVLLPSLEKKEFF